VNTIEGRRQAPMMGRGGQGIGELNRKNSTSVARPLSQIPGYAHAQMCWAGWAVDGLGGNSNGERSDRHVRTVATSVA